MLTRSSSCIPIYAFCCVFNFNFSVFNSNAFRACINDGIHREEKVINTHSVYFSLERITTFHPSRTWKVQPSSFSPSEAFSPKTFRIGIHYLHRLTNIDLWRAFKKHLRVIFPKLREILLAFANTSRTQIVFFKVTADISTSFSNEVLLSTFISFKLILMVYILFRPES